MIQRPDTAQGYANLLRSDFEFFCQEMWVFLDLERFHTFGPIERIVARHLAYGRRMRGILAWRFFGKTFLIAMLILWRLLNNPNRHQVIVTISMPESRKRVKMIRQWIERVPFLESLRPEPGQRDGGDGFDVAGAEGHKDFSVGCKGMDGQIAGIHGDVIADDIEDENNSGTRDAREALFNRTAEFDAVAGENDEIVVIGTLHSEESVYPKLANLKDKDGKPAGYDFITIPILYPRPEQHTLNLAPELRANLDNKTAQPGDIVAPYRITREYVAKKAARERWFAMQFMLQTNVMDTVRFPLKLRNLIVFDSQRDFGPSRIAWGLSSDSKGTTELPNVRPNGHEGDSLHGPMFVDLNSLSWLPYTRTILTIDTGGGKGQTAWKCGSALNGYIFVHDGGAMTGSASNANITMLVERARFHNCRVISVEGNQVGSRDTDENAWANLLRAEVARQALDTEPAWNCSVEVHWARGGKETRIINTLEPLFANHRIILHSRVALDPKLQFQITRITSQPGSLDQADRIDALEALCRLLLDTTRLDPSKAARDAETTNLIREWEEATGQRSRHPRASWCSKR